jgi:uncharacterized membrane protein YeaQ/YmgE (transglycosylase-associated protein family)
MAVIFWIVLGVLVSSVAKLVLWNDGHGSWPPVLLAGPAGAIMGGYIAVRTLPASEMRGFDPFSMLLVAASAAGVAALFCDLRLDGKRRTAEPESPDRFRDAA